MINPALLHRYHAFKGRLRGQGQSVAERLTFHGTSAAAIDEIVAEGFRIGGVDVQALAGASLGRGIYSSESPAFAMQCQWPRKSESERVWQLLSSASIDSRCDIAPLLSICYFVLLPAASQTSRT